MIVLGAGQTGASKELRSNNDQPLIGLACGQQDGTVILVMVLVNGIGGGHDTVSWFVLAFWVQLQCYGATPHMAVVKHW